MRFLILLVPALMSAQGMDTVQIRTQRVADGIYVLYGRGGNIGLAVGADAVFVVDDQYAPLTPKILAAIRAVTDQPVRFVLNTHWHFDHTGGNEAMGKAGALVLAHENVRRRMSAPQFIEFLRRDMPAAAPGALPVVTFSERIAFHINGDEMRIVHVPAAHTDGDAIVFFTRANVVHMGDVFVTYGYPFVDGSSGGSLSGVIAAADLVLAQIDDRTVVIPGHGEPTDRAALRAFRDMLSTVRDRVRERVRRGETLDQILAAKPTADLDARWSGSFVKGDDIVRFAWTDLGGSPKED